MSPPGMPTETDLRHAIFALAEMFGVDPMRISVRVACADGVTITVAGSDVAPITPE